MSGFDKKQTAASPDDIDQKMKMLSVMEKVAKATGQPAPGAAPGGAAADVNSMQSVEEIKAYIQQQQYQKEMEKYKKKMEKADVDKEHKFWNTQPMAKLTKASEAEPEVTVNEAMDKNTDVSKVRQEPYKLPEGFEWVVLDVDSDEQLNELYHLLTNNYVEDDDASFRFDYSPAFLRWALTIPEFNPQWHIGVRATKTGTCLC